jgi:hypothetical protein
MNPESNLVYLFIFQRSAPCSRCGSDDLRRGGSPCWRRDVGIGGAEEAAAPALVLLEFLRGLGGRQPHCVHG